MMVVVIMSHFLKPQGPEGLSLKHWRFLVQGNENSTTILPAFTTGSNTDSNPLSNQRASANFPFKPTGGANK